MSENPIYDIIDLWHEFLYRKNKGEKIIVINYRASNSEIQRLRKKEINVTIEITKLKNSVRIKII